MSGLLKTFDPESADDETRRLSRLAQKCWAPLAIVYDPLKAGSIDSTDTIPHDRGVVRALNSIYVPDKCLKSRPKCTIFVGGLSRQTTADILREEFSQYGRIVNVTVVEDIVTGRSRGYGFIEFSLEGEAIRAYERAEKKWIDGKKIIVDMECSRLLPGWVPRRLGGGFNGRRESGQLRFGCRERPFRKPIKLLTETEILKVYEKTMGRKIKRNETDEAGLNEESTVDGRSQKMNDNPEKDETEPVKMSEEQERKKRRDERTKRKKKNKRRSRSKSQDDRKKRKRERREEKSRMRSSPV